MAKIKINKLPKGFKLVDGKVVEEKVMRNGGDIYSTGDQADYGLVTTPQEYYGQTMFNNTDDQSTRYSLSGVPREDANIEAEGGETVLTDLNDDGNFGLYSITGPRHSQGGVPMFLPEQSFIFSDTPKLKFTKDEMSEFGMGGSKKTPAKISKNFGLNNYYAELDSQYADEISAVSAELMLKKNMEDLSKLAYMQEAKKNFEDGVPLAAHPFLLSENIDPLQFTAQVEDISQQQARQNAIAQLSPGQQEQLFLVQQMLQQQQNQVDAAQAPDPSQFANQMQMANADNDMLSMAEYGYEMREFLDKAQRGTEIVYNRMEDGDYGIPRKAEATEGMYYVNAIPGNEDFGKGYIFKDGDYVHVETVAFDEDFNIINRVPAEETVTDTESIDIIGSGNTEVVETEEETTNTNSEFNPFPVGSENYIEIENLKKEGYTFSIVKDGPEKGKLRAYRPRKSRFDAQGDREIAQYETTGSGGNINVYDDNVSSQGDVLRNSSIANERYGRLAGVRPETQGFAGGDFAFGTKEIESQESQEAFERMWSDVLDDIEGWDYRRPAFKNEEDKEKYLRTKDKSLFDPEWLAQWKQFQIKSEELRKADAERLGIPYVPYYKNPGDEGYRTGDGPDGIPGLNTYNTPRFDVDVQTEDERFFDLPKKKETIEIPDIEEAEGPVKRYWAQDMNNMTALGLMKDELFLPWSPKLEEQKIDYVLDDYTGRVNAIMGAQNVMSGALGAYGPQAIARSNIQGKTLNEIGKAIQTTNTNNVNTMNRVAAAQASMDNRIDAGNVGIERQLYDDTQASLQQKQNFDNAKIAKANELWNTAITNASNTYNINTMYDEYNIRPDFGGDVLFTGIGRKPYKDTSQNKQEAFLDAYTKLRKNLPADQKITPELLNMYMQLGNNGGYTPSTQGKAALQQRGITGYSGSNIPVGEKGTEIKNLPKAFPNFTVGKMGV